MLEFMTWDGVVVGSEIWSETNVVGTLNINEVATDYFGKVYGGGGTGQIRSFIRNQRRVYVDAGQQHTFHFVADASFATREGDNIRIYGVRNRAINDMFLFFHSVNKNTGQSIDLLEPAPLANNKDVGKGEGAAAILIFIFIFVVAIIAGISQLSFAVFFIIAAIGFVPSWLLRPKHKAHVAEVSWIRSQLVNYVSEQNKTMQSAQSKDKYYESEVYSIDYLPVTKVNRRRWKAG